MCEVSQRHEANNIFMAASKLPPSKYITHATVKPQAHFLALGSLVPRLKLERQAVQDAQGIRKSTSRSSEVKKKRGRERESAKENYNTQDVWDRGAKKKHQIYGRTSKLSVKNILRNRVSECKRGQSWFTVVQIHKSSWTARDLHFIYFLTFKSVYNIMCTFAAR